MDESSDSEQDEDNFPLSPLVAVRPTEPTRQPYTYDPLPDDSTSETETEQISVRRMITKAISTIESVSSVSYS